MAPNRGTEPVVSEHRLTVGLSLAPAAAVFVAYALLADLSFLFANPPNYPVWLPAGVGVAALLLAPTRRWPGLIAAMVLAHLLASLRFGLELPLAVSYAFTDNVAPVLGAALVRHVFGRTDVRLTTVRQVVLYGVLAGGVAWLVASMLGTIATGLWSPLDISPLYAALQVWIGALIGVIGIGGAILLWAARPESGPNRPLLSLEGLVLVLTLLLQAATLVVIGPANLVYLAFLFVFWAAARFGPLVATLVALVIAFETLLLTLMGRGPFDAPGISLQAAAAELQAFLAVLVSSALVLSAGATERQRKKRALTESEERYRAFIANSSEGIWRIDVVPPMPVDLPQDEQVEYLLEHSVSAEVNEAMARFHGFSTPAEMVGRQVTSIVPAETCRPLVQELVIGGYRAKTQSYNITLPNGEERWYQGGTAGIVENGHLVRLWGTLSDVTERMRYLRELEYQSLHDNLTGLPNRLKLNRELAEAAEECRTSERLGALLLMDLNRFKEVNDALGHEAGDELLRELAERLRRLMDQEHVLVARMGGDEFAVLARGVSRVQQVVALAHELLGLVRDPFAVKGLSVEVGGSVGIALFADPENAGSTLLRQAEVAMYQAKDRAGGLAIYRPEADPYSPQRLAAVTDIGRAIRLGQLDVHFQPKVDAATGAPIGLEVLARWHHPRLGQVPPSTFVPIVELSEMIGPFTRWVVERALRQMALWRDQGLSVHCAVNVSARNLMDEAFPDTVESLLAKYAVEPRQLELEITETAVMADPERSLRVLSRLRQMGVGLSIDDFGTGHSSLAYLKRFPIAALKIDRSFVHAMTRSDLDRIIVTSTIHLAHDLGLLVVAEGVEDIETLDCLRQLGCDQAQGFYISEPLPAADAAAWLHARVEAVRQALSDESDREARRPH